MFGDSDTPGGRKRSHSPDEEAEPASKKLRKEDGTASARDKPEAAEDVAMEVYSNPDDKTQIPSFRFELSALSKTPPVSSELRDDIIGTAKEHNSE